MIKDDYGLDQFRKKYLTPTAKSNVVSPPVKKVTAPKKEATIPPVKTTPVKEAPKRSFAGNVLNTISKPLAGVGGFIEGQNKDLTKRLQNKESAVPAYLKSLLAGVKNIPSGIREDTHVGKAFQGIAERAPNTRAGNVVKKIYGNPATQFAGDVGLDPLTYVPVAGVAKAVTKIPGIKQIASKGDDALNILSKNKTLRSATDTFNRKFVKHKAAPKEVLEALDNVTHEFGQKAPGVVEKYKQVFENLSPAENTIVARALELKPVSAGSSVKEGFDELIKEAGGPKVWKERIAPVIEEVQKSNRQQLRTSLERGQLTQKKFDELMKKAYYPHTDFAPTSIGEKLRNFWSRKGFSYRGYERKRKGALGYTMNAAKATSQRELRQLRDDLLDDALIKIRDQFGKRLGRGKKLPEGWKYYMSDAKGPYKRFKGYAFPPEVYKYLDEVIAETNIVLRGLDKIQGLWKFSATVVNPAFHVTNMIGNISQAFLGGMHAPKRFKQAIIGGFSKAEDDLVKKAGVLRETQMTHELSGQFDDLFTKNTVKIGSPVSLFNRFGDWTENNARKALFLETYERLIRSGENADSAMKLAREHVNKYLFDYLNGLTPYESRVMRKIFPFYTWSRKNIPLQIEAFGKQTGKQSALLKGQAYLNEDREFTQDEGELSGIDIAPAKQFGPERTWKVPLPQQDVLDPDVGRRAVGMISPVLKLPVAIGDAMFSNLSGGNRNPQDYFTGRDITDTQLPIQEQARDYGRYATTNLFRPGRTLEKLGQQDSQRGILENLFMTGVRNKRTEQDIQIDQIYDRKGREEAIKRKVEQVLRNPNLTQEQKNDEIERLLSY